MKTVEPSEYYPILTAANGGIGLAAGIASLLHFFFAGNSEAMPSILGAGIWTSLAFLLSAMAAKLNTSFASRRKSLVIFDAVMTSVSFMLSLVSFLRSSVTSMMNYSTKLQVLIFISALTMAPLILLLESQNSDKVR